MRFPSVKPKNKVALGILLGMGLFGGTLSVVVGAYMAIVEGRGGGAVQAMLSLVAFIALLLEARRAIRSG